MESTLVRKEFRIVFPTRVCGVVYYADMGTSEPTGRDLVPGFAAMIAAVREAKGMSRNELAKASGLSVNSVSAIEREIRAPSLRVASALVVALGLKVWLHEPGKVAEDEPAPKRRPKKK